MATSFPQSVQTFPTMLDITATDGALIKQYQDAIQAQNMTLAAQIFAQIPNAIQKIINANYVNTVNDTNVAIQNYYLARYSPAYIVSQTQPPQQEVTDFWFETEVI